MVIQNRSGIRQKSGFTALAARQMAGHSVENTLLTDVDRSREENFRAWRSIIRRRQP